MTTIQQFVAKDYFNHVESSLSVSSVDGYRKIWNSYGHFLDGMEFGAPVHLCQKVLRDICLANPHLKKTTVTHIKNFFSGVWTAALRLGYTEGNSNPWRMVAIPTAPESLDTYAYSPDEVSAMLSALSSPYELIVLFFACTGLRKSEARGVQWGDIDLETKTLSVQRAVWRDVVKTTKNKSSKAIIPIVPTLAARLEQYKQTTPHENKNFLFANSEREPLDLDFAAVKVIRPALEKAGIQFRGFHAFRRGLATTLHAQNVPDKEIQRILRHSNVSTTQNCYVKTLPENIRKAMRGVNFGNPL